jgi:uncharacterized protein YukE
MTRIVVVPENLRSLSSQLQRAGQEINAISSRVGGALGGLDWEARQKAGVDSQANDARGRASAMASQAEAMARYLIGKAQAFEQADQQGATDLQVVIDKYPIPMPVPTPEPGGTPVSLPSLDTVFDVFKASLSTVSLFVTSLGLDAVKVFAGAGDFFLRKLPNAEAAFRRWEDYNRQDNWNRATADQYQEDARKALEELGVSGLKDTLDLVADKIPKSDVIDEALKKAYDAIGAVGDWIDALGAGKK